MSIFWKLAQSAAMGALPTLRALLDPTAQGGDYYGPDGFRSSRGHPIKVGSSQDAQNPELADRLWVVSEELTGISYSWTNDN